MSTPEYHGWTEQGKGRVAGKDWDYYANNDLMGWVSPLNGKFRAVARQGGEVQILGYFDTLEEAKARVALVLELES